VKKPVGFFFRRIPTYGRNSSPLRKAAVLTNSRIHLSPALEYTSACQGLAVGGCCEAAAYGIRPWTPWIWGILNFRSIRVIESHIKGTDDVGESKPTGRFEDN